MRSDATGRSRKEREEEASQAAREAGIGALAGAARWGLFAATLGVVAYTYSPIYRGLTIQFKLYIQMSGMIVGGWTEADRRMRQYEARTRMERKMKIDRARWEAFERELEEMPKSEAEK